MKPTKRVMNGLQELTDFAKGRGGPLTLYMPDGKDGLEKRVVKNMAEYRSALTAEFERIVAPYRERRR